MNNDLISREALRKAFHGRIYYFNKSSWDEANALIDNAPTVADRTEEVLSLQNTIAKLVEGIAENARPQGEWIDYNAYYKTCSICKRTVGIDFLIQKYEDKPEGYSFCPNCGAKMKGGAV